MSPTLVQSYLLTFFSLGFYTLAHGQGHGIFEVASSTEDRGQSNLKNATSNNVYSGKDFRKPIINTLGEIKFHKRDQKMKRVFRNKNLNRRVGRKSRGRFKEQKDKEKIGKKKIR